MWLSPKGTWKWGTVNKCFIESVNKAMFYKGLKGVLNPNFRPFSFELNKK